MRTKIVAILLAIIVLMTSCRAVVPDYNEDPDLPDTDFSSDLDIRKVSHFFDREFGLWHGAETSFGYYYFMQRWVDGFSDLDAHNPHLKHLSELNSGIFFSFISIAKYGQFLAHIPQCEHLSSFTFGNSAS